MTQCSLMPPRPMRISSQPVALSCVSADTRPWGLMENLFSGHTVASRRYETLTTRAVTVEGSEIDRVLLHMLFRQHRYFGKEREAFSEVLQIVNGTETIKMALCELESLYTESSALGS
ncbi:hypothetical protein CB0940_00726 [Cercospora beticola]|uniref:Uncharacterized protein n=1 Tax=Cercospora beticola TaxID=122368 RepID=A0A2G5IBT7_CERBT|nr:hypothetical protein CB0940_00726 [Cercospora beticola]PIB02172.1 hypothetical protein CB0940_00726 [Cercospora beticola]WPA96154.1 hypothetical protein RHO25_000760 [Cercospora beticola]